jgi:cell division septation protein DedD
MDRLSTYRIPVDAATLHRSVGESALSPDLMEPMQALVTAVTRRGSEGPFSLYVCADDPDAAVRDDLAVLLARALAPHVPSALLVDCDFTNLGLHGYVPQKDALGFLDFLLYGSSLGVITQESAGVRVVSAGSFPVTRRMPFVETAFADAARRLVAHARCAIFVGPAFDESGAPHPLAAETDVVAVVSPDPRATTADRLAAGASDVWNVEFGAAPAAVAPPSPPIDRPALRGSDPLPPVAEPVTASVPRAAVTREGETRDASLLPRVAIVGFGVVVVAFAVWWFTMGRGTADEPVESAQPVTTGTPDRVPPAVGEPVDTLTRDPALLAAVTADTMTAGGDTTPVPVPPPTDEADTGGRTGGTQLIGYADIHVMADLEAQWKDWYLIHISSFQESIRAREEVAFLRSREFPVFIVFLDLGAKGSWYRVYCGPFRTREEARDVKKNLDAIPQVRFTRIARIPE